MNTKAQIIPLAVLAALCFGGCERRGEPDRPYVNDANEPGPNTALPGGNQATPATDDESRTIAEHGGRNPAVSENTPGGADAPAGQAPGYTVPKADPHPHDEVAPSPTDPGTAPAAGPQTRREFVDASRRRLAELETELQQLETRSRSRGQQLRAEIREEKRRLDQQLERMDRESEEVWTEMKEGFADALGRLETQIRRFREDLDPES